MGRPDGPDRRDVTTAHPAAEDRLAAVDRPDDRETIRARGETTGRRAAKAGPAAAPAAE